MTGRGLYLTSSRVRERSTKPGSCFITRTEIKGFWPTFSNNGQIRPVFCALSHFFQSGYKGRRDKLIGIRCAVQGETGTAGILKHLVLYLCRFHRYSFAFEQSTTHSVNSSEGYWISTSHCMFLLVYLMVWQELKGMNCKKKKKSVAHFSFSPKCSQTGRTDFSLLDMCFFHLILKLQDRFNSQLKLLVEKQQFLVKINSVNEKKLSS